MEDEGPATWTLQGAPRLEPQELAPVPSRLIFKNEKDTVSYLRAKLRVLVLDDEKSRKDTCVGRF